MSASSAMAHYSGQIYENLIWRMKRNQVWHHMCWREELYDFWIVRDGQEIPTTPEKNHNRVSTGVAVSHLYAGIK